MPDSTVSAIDPAPVECAAIAIYVTAMITQLHADIDTRVSRIREQTPDWPCAKGCDTCCRQLADVPQLSSEEWRLLKAGLATLPAEQLAEIRRRIAELPIERPHRVTCPMLDPATGACPVYAHRPVACRTYGFYVQRDKGLYCADIESRVVEGRLAEVVWGNHEVIDLQLANLGAKRSLTAWFNEGALEETSHPC